MATSAGSLDPSMIHGFLDDHRQIQNEWQLHTARSPVYGVPVHPYEAQMPLTLPNELSPNTRYRAPSQSSSSNRSRHPSVFSRSSQITSTSATSSIPSRRSEYTPDVAGMVANSYPTLPCEFMWRGYGGRCSEIFYPHEMGLWIDHIISNHLRGQLPSKVVCWFCDDYTFNAETTGGDLRTNFDNRMTHISQHIDEGSTVDEIRPDFYLLKHLKKHKLVSKDVVEDVKTREGPGHTMGGIYEHDWIPEEQAREIERQSRVTVDLEREERERRRNRHRHGNMRT